MEQKHIELSEKAFSAFFLKLQSAILFSIAEKGLITLAEREDALSQREIPQDDE